MKAKDFGMSWREAENAVSGREPVLALAGFMAVTDLNAFGSHASPVPHSGKKP